MADVVQVSTTADSESVAVALASSAVQSRLAACAQIQGPVNSLFWHEGRFDTGEEWQLTFKTTAERYTDLEAHLIAGHPWRRPELTVLEVDSGSTDYRTWVHESVAPQRHGS